jgi:translocation and assembly module TamB
LTAKGVLRGSANSMRVLLEANGDDLKLPMMQVGRLRATVDVDPLTGASAPATIDVSMANLQAVGRDIERLDFKLQGSTAEHRLALDVRDRDATIKARGVGSFDTQTWQHRWDQLDLDLPADIGLAVVDPLSMTFTMSSADVEPFCLRARKVNELTGSAELCLSAAWSEGAWNARFDIARLPIASVLPEPWLKASYDGSISAAASIGAAATGPLLGTLRADFRDARLNWLRASGKRDIIPLGSGYLDVSSSSDAIIGLLDIAAGERGRASGQLLAVRGAGSWSEMPLQAKLIADSTALGLLNLYVPEIDRSAGDLSMDFDFGGTVGAPLVNGVLRLERGELDFYQINLALRDIDAEARLIDNRIALQSSARAGQGSIRADADLEWRGSLPFGSLRIRGADIPIIDLPEARITATPNLEFKVTGRDLLATGTVLVPSARLTPVDLTGAVSTSTDEIIVGAEPVDPSSSFRVSSDIKLTLGDRVTVDSFGLSGRVAGNINVRSTPDGVNRGSGELGVVEGKYAALGRRLDIERGRLIFSGGLINDPGVDIRATKEFPDVKAGVNVRGTLREPRMSFFSEPSLPQSQVVSLILAGGTIETTQSGDSTSSASRNALLAQGGAILAQQLGQRIGIEDVGIEQNLANETSLVFGKYLSSRLYVSYGISLAETLNTLKLRYSINDRWTVRTEAGKEVSADVVYTVEKP